MEQYSRMMHAEPSTSGNAVRKTVIQIYILKHLMF